MCGDAVVCSRLGNIDLINRHPYRTLEIDKYDDSTEPDGCGGYTFTWTSADYQPYVTFLTGSVGIESPLYTDYSNSVFTPNPATFSVTISLTSYSTATSKSVSFTVSLVDSC